MLRQLCMAIIKKFLKCFFKFVFNSCISFFFSSFQQKLFQNYSFVSALALVEIRNLFNCTAVCLFWNTQYWQKYDVIRATHVRISIWYRKRGYFTDFGAFLKIFANVHENRTLGLKWHIANILVSYWNHFKLFFFSYVNTHNASHKCMLSSRVNKLFTKNFPFLFWTSCSVAMLSICFGFFFTSSEWRP